MTSEGPAGWANGHQNVRLRPIEAADLDLLMRFDTDPAFLGQFEWRDFRDPQARRRRWEQDSYLGADDSMLIVSLPDGAATGLISWTAIRSSTPTAPTVTYRIGIALLPEHRGQGLGSAVQCLLADHLFSVTMANRIEAGTELANLAEQRALEKAGFHREGVARGAGYRNGEFVDGVTYARLRSDPHP